MTEIEEFASRDTPRKPSEIIFGRYPTNDLILSAASTDQLQKVRERIVDQVLEAAENRGMEVRSIRYYPAERDRTVFDPLDQRWVIRWEAVLE